MRVKKVKKLEYHRNGVCGRGFYVGIIEDEEGREMLAVRFPDQDKDGILCAVFDLALLDKRNIQFGQNSWRGDHYSDAMDKAITKDEKESL